MLAVPTRPVIEEGLPRRKGQNRPHERNKECAHYKVPKTLREYSQKNEEVKKSARLDKCIHMDIETLAVGQKDQQAGSI